jgi:integrase
LLEEWFCTFKEPLVSSRTAEKIRNYMKNHIKPEFYGLEVQQIDFFRMQKFLNGIQKKGHCLETVKQIKQVLNQFYVQYIIKKGMVKKNPLDDVKIRTVERDDQEKETMALSPELRREVMAKVAGEPILKPILTTLLLTGIRPGELIALRWMDVDLENADVSVRLAAGREIEFDDEGNVTKRSQVISNTKTVLSVRSFKVAESVVMCLKEWLAYQLEQERKTGLNLTSKDCHVFCTNKGTMRSYSGLRTMLVRFLKRNNLSDKGINLYTFRHTFATVLLEERENPKIVSELMGHAKVLTTLTIYSHVLSKTVYKNTAQTLDRVSADVLAGGKKADAPYDGTPTLALSNA